MPRDGARTSPLGRYDGPPMTLGDMRENGVRTLDAWCLGRDCHHHRTLDVDAMPDDVAVPSIGPRLRCERCGRLGADARPNWSEYRAAGAWRRNEDRKGQGHDHAY
jgi:hypothetical protein